MVITKQSRTTLLVVLHCFLLCCYRYSTVIKFPCVYFDYLNRFCILWGQGILMLLLSKTQKGQLPIILELITLHAQLGCWLIIKCESTLEKLIFLSWSHSDNYLQIPDRNTLSTERESARERTDGWLISAYLGRSWCSHTELLGNRK